MSPLAPPANPGAALTPRERAVDTILAALEDRPASIREGTDPLVLLYWWKQQNPDTGLFMRALEDMDRDGLIVLGPPPERRVRLSTHGFAWLEARLPVEVDAPEDAGAAETPAAEAPPTKPARGPAAASPLAERIAAVVRIFATLDLPPGRGVAAATLLRIWTLDERPGAELRETLDAMAANGRLVIARGVETTFALVSAG